MRRIGDLMKELGFNPEGPISTQKAFLQHLIEAARVSQIDRKLKPLPEEGQQLSFDLEIDSETTPKNLCEEKTRVG